jgi:hypothetical protein
MGRRQPAVSEPEVDRTGLVAALASYKEAKQARTSLSRPDPEVERRVWKAAADALRICASSAQGELVPGELASDLAQALETILAGRWPDELEAARKRLPDLPGGQRARYIEDAVRYLVACREGVVRGLTFDQAVAEVLDEYEVSRGTVMRWLKTVTADGSSGARLLAIPANELPDDLVGRDLATRIDIIMRRSGYAFRRWPRIAGALV